MFVVACFQPASFIIRVAFHVTNFEERVEFVCLVFTCRTGVHVTNFEERVEFMCLVFTCMTGESYHR